MLGSDCRYPCDGCAACSDDAVAEATRRRTELAYLLWEYAGPLMPRILAACGQSWTPTSPQLLDLVEGDLMALVWRDPATHGSWRTVLEVYRSFRAVLTYRLAHAILVAGAAGGSPERATVLARQLSERAKVETGVELHPAARIGPRFVVDHGVGTIVGETSVIGADCYILQCVVLGSLKIADNPAGRRHPALGDRVEVGAFARILGPLRIGDDAKIGAHALVRDDVPDGSRVSVLHQYQVVVGHADIAITGVEAAGQGRFRVHGRGLDDPTLWAEPEPGASPEDQKVSIVDQQADQLVLEVTDAAHHRRTFIRLSTADGAKVSLQLPTLRLGRTNENSITNQGGAS